MRAAVRAGIATGMRHGVRLMGADERTVRSGTGITVILVVGACDEPCMVSSLTSGGAGQ